MAQDANSRQTQKGGRRGRRRASNGSVNGSGNGSGGGGRAAAFGSWKQRFDRYMALAQDAAAHDRVEAENYYQHAEHYYRLMNSSAA